MNKWAWLAVIILFIIFNFGKFPLVFVNPIVMIPYLAGSFLGILVMVYILTWIYGKIGGRSA